MLTVRANGTQYSMSFEQRNVKRLGREGFENVVETVCRIYLKDLFSISEGVAQRSPQDEEDTPKALELSMKRALEGVQFTVWDKPAQTAFRAAFWEALRAAIWNEWKPEEDDSEDISGESPLPPPEPIVDAIPVESDEVKRLRALLERSLADHASFGDSFTDCPICETTRQRLKQALVA